MTRSEFLFKVIDILCHPGQNYRRYPGIVQEEAFVYDAKRPHACTAEYFYDPKLVKSGEKMPVVLNIHGGGFVKGDKKHRKSLCKRFANHGYFTMNINYGLGPKDPYPAGVIDCMNALNYLVKTAEKFNIDLSRVCVTGDSAGAYCATYLVAMAANPALCEKIGAPKCLVKPALLVSFCGPYDLIAALSLTKLPFNLVWDIGRCYLGKQFGLKKDFSNLEDYKFIEEVGPIGFVNSDWCPSFLVMSEKDIFCKGQGEILEGKLKEAGVEVDSFASHKFLENHCFHLEFFKKISKKCFAKAFAFMDSHLKVATPIKIEETKYEEPKFEKPVVEEEPIAVEKEEIPEVVTAEAVENVEAVEAVAAAEVVENAEAVGVAEAVEAEAEIEAADAVEEAEVVEETAEATEEAEVAENAEVAEEAAEETVEEAEASVAETEVAEEAEVAENAEATEEAEDVETAEAVEEATEEVAEAVEEAPEVAATTDDEETAEDAEVAEVAETTEDDE